MSWQKLLEWDARFSTRLRLGERPGLLRKLAILLAHSGDSWFWLLGLALIWYRGTDYWRERAVQLIIGILITAVLVMLIKLIVRRRRPEGEWGSIYRNTDPHSFPSGHAARATMLTVLALYMGPTWFGVVLLIWMPIMALARVAMGVHYLTDVFGGVIIGLIIGLGGLWHLSG